MENKTISVQDYIELNKEYVNFRASLDEKIKNELKNNKEEYPVGAEELFFFEYDKELSEEDENKIMLIENILGERLKDDYDLLASLRDQIVAYSSSVASNQETEENLSEN